MSYSDYGGYAYRNGKRVVQRSDATISPDGDIFGSPGTWPGFAAMIAGGESEYERRKDWPSGHAVLGDGPIYAALYKQTALSLYRRNERLDLSQLQVAGQAPPVKTFTFDGKTYSEIDLDEAVKMLAPVVYEIDGWRIEHFLRNEDNYYQYVRLAQPDGNVWHGWSGYGVGAGLEEAGYGYNTREREETLCSLFPDIKL